MSTTDRVVRLRRVVVTLAAAFGVSVLAAGCAGADEDPDDFDLDAEESSTEQADETVGTSQDELTRGPCLTAAHVARLAHNAGIPCGNRLIISVAVSTAESSRCERSNNRNSNGTIDRGLWQINSIHGGFSTYDPQKNARGMVHISSRGRNWHPWTVYNSGAYRRFLRQARHGANAVCNDNN